VQSRKDLRSTRRLESRRAAAEVHGGASQRRRVLADKTVLVYRRPYVFRARPRPDPDYAVRMLCGPRRKRRGFQQREQARVHADREDEHGDCRDGVQGLADQHPQAVARILDNALQP
jgi:hypothetical protein